VSSGNGGIYLGPGEGRTVSILGTEIGLKAGTADTGGHYGLIEYTAGPEFMGPAPHLHPEMEEAFYVLEGEFTIRLGGDSILAPAGSFVLIPRGTVHTFSNPGPTSSKFLLIVSPGGFERYFEELAPLVEQHGFPPPEAMQRLSEKYNFRVAEPPTAG